jgi:hypothetical protein
MQYWRAAMAPEVAATQIKRATEGVAEVYKGSKGAGVSPELERVAGLFTKEAKARALQAGLSKSAIRNIEYETVSAIKAQQRRGFSRIGLVKPYTDEAKTMEVVFHERAHVYLPEELRGRMTGLSGEATTRFSLPRIAAVKKQEFLLEEMFAYEYANAVQFGGRFKKARHAYTNIFEEARLSVDLRINKIEGMKKRGLSYWLRSRHHDFGKSFSGLRALMSKIGGLFRSGFRKPPVTNDMMGKMVNLLRETGRVVDDEAARAMIKNAKWITVGDSKWLRMERIGAGGAATADLMISAAGDSVGVLKRHHRGILGTTKWTKESVLLPRQVMPLKYEAYMPKNADALEVWQTILTKHATRPGTGADPARSMALRYIDAAEEFGKRFPGMPGTSKADLYFAREYLMNVEVPSTAKAALMLEADLQEQAFIRGDMALRVFEKTGKVTEKGILPTIRRWIGGEEYGFVQEYGGISLGEALSKNMVPKSKVPEIERVLRQSIDETLEGGGVVNWDLSSANIVLNPRTWEPKIIDWGAATYFEPGIDAAYKTYAKEYGDTVINRVFQSYRGSSKAAANNLVIAQSKHAAGQMASTSGKQEIAQAMADRTSHKRRLAKIEASRRKHHMASMQTEVSKMMFRNPNKHHKGGN